MNIFISKFIKLVLSFPGVCVPFGHEKAQVQSEKHPERVSRGESHHLFS